MFSFRILLLLILTAYCPLLFAQAEENTPKVSELNWTNTTFLSNQRSLVDELARRHFGTLIRGDKSDLHTLQRLLDDEAIARDDKASLQALGVILGDVYTTENNNLQWRVYEDELGRSHAICIKNTQHCLFPITMLSRRIEAGLNPKVAQVYQKGLESLKPHLPKLPFAGPD